MGLSAGETSSRWGKLPAGARFSILIPPVTGGIYPEASLPGGGRNIQSVEESTHRLASQRPDSSSRWGNLPDGARFGVLIPPVTGGIYPESKPFSGQNIQRVEEMGC